MPRDLTADETAALADVVVDPAAWWAHAQAAHPTPEAALAAKLARHKRAYETRKGAGNYKTRAQREPKL